MFSIIIPVYNLEKYIARCINSIILQTYKNWELIIIDDGSKDKSWSIIQEFAKLDKRIVSITKNNEGVSSARNLGLQMARGDYIVIIDGDDWVEKDLLSDAELAFQNREIDVFMFEYYVDRNGNSSKHYAPKDYYGVIDNELALISTIRPYNRFAVTKIFKAELLNGEDGKKLQFDNDISIGEDTLFICRVLEQARKILYTEKAYYHYDQRLGSAIRSDFNEKKLSVFNAYNRIKKLMNAKGFSNAAECTDVSIAEIGLRLACQVSTKTTGNELILRDIQKQILLVESAAMNSKYSNNKIKVKYLLCKISIHAYNKIERIFERMRRGIV